ncbi:hypothetical protein FOPG_20224 [Fusarium oxysporum f. sp. conglutinans race 2 54008]|uniref:Uncharacterized protein n=1 Tax=Fusarium oxysporum f. sp. conglutinans race 2 54008 TaxID=1089457 RepID=X0GIP0_FUSOX|nr:hypothetical protein FOPG_20224 [Fusarium oxysporum f. sp. conglutinans race 2 54008]
MLLLAKTLAEHVFSRVLPLPSSRLRLISPSSLFSTVSMSLTWNT